jgi:hypothetical protein
MFSVFNGGLDMKGAVNAENALVVHMDVVVSVQLVTYSPVSHIRMCFMDFLDLTRNAFVLQLMVTLRVLQPSVIC